MTVLEQADIQALHALDVIKVEGKTFVQILYSVANKEYGKLTHLRLPNGQTVEAIAPALSPTINEVRPMQEQPPIAVSAPVVSNPSTTEKVEANVPPQTETPPATETVNAGAPAGGKKSKASATDAPTNVATDTSSDVNGG